MKNVCFFALLMFFLCSCNQKPSDEFVKDTFTNLFNIKTDVKEFKILNSYKTERDGDEIYEYLVSAVYQFKYDDSSIIGTTYQVDKAVLHFKKLGNGKWFVLNLKYDVPPGKIIAKGTPPRGESFSTLTFEGNIDKTPVTLEFSGVDRKLSGKICYPSYCNNVSGSGNIGFGMEIWEYTKEKRDDSTFLRAGTLRLEVFGDTLKGMYVVNTGITKKALFIQKHTDNIRH